jgi:L-alanine-DL-glutamate epimerase-like enolase superfamily enzyme
LLAEPSNPGLPPLKITEVRVIVTCPDRNYVLVKVLTNEPGLYGVGDATLNGRELSVATTLEKHTAPLLIGRDPEQIEDTWQYLYRGPYWRGGPTQMTALAGVDLALREAVPLITEQLIDYIRCDVAHIGGIATARKVAALAELFHVKTAWHGPADIAPPTHAVNIHLDISIPNFGIQEMVFFPDVAREVMPGSPTFKDGYMHVDDTPGLGTDVNEEMAKKYPYRRAYLPTARRRDGSVQDW